MNQWCKVPIALNSASTAYAYAWRTHTRVNNKWLPRTDLSFAFWQRRAIFIAKLQSAVSSNTRTRDIVTNRCHLMTIQRAERWRPARLSNCKSNASRWPNHANVHHANQVHPAWCADLSLQTGETCAELPDIPGIPTRRYAAQVLAAPAPDLHNKRSRRLRGSTLPWPVDRSISLKCVKPQTRRSQQPYASSSATHENAVPVRLAPFSWYTRVCVQPIICIQ